MRWPGRVVVATSSGVTLVGTFLPWLSSGSVDRSSFDLLDVVERLGFAPDGVVGAALRIWPLVPLALVMCAIAQAPPVWARTGALVGVGLPLLVGSYVTAVAVTVRVAPDVGLFRLRFGATLTLVGALAMLAGSAPMLVRRGRPTDPARSAPA